MSLGGNIVPASMGSARGTMLVSFVLSAIVLVGFVSMARRELTAASLPGSAFSRDDAALAVVDVPIRAAADAVSLLVPGRRHTGHDHVVGSNRETRPASASSDCTPSTTRSTSFIRFTNPQALDWAADAAEVDTVTTWMQQNLTESGHVATSNPALVYLRTGQRTDLPRTISLRTGGPGSARGSGTSWRCGRRTCRRPPSAFIP